MNIANVCEDVGTSSGSAGELSPSSSSGSGKVKLYETNSRVARSDISNTYLNNKIMEQSCVEQWKE